MALSLTLAALAALASVAAPSPGDAAAPCVTDVAALARRSLAFPVEEGAFDVTGTVTCVVAPSPHQVCLTFTDGTACAYARALVGPHEVPCSPGDTARLAGHIAYLRANCATVHLEQIELVRRGAAPEPAAVRVGELKDGSRDWQWASVTGVVRDVVPSETNARFAILVLAADGAAIPVSVPVADGGADAVAALLGRTVTVRGFANPQSGSARRYVGRIFQCPDARLAVAAPPDGEDPFAAPSVDALRHLDPAAVATLGRTRAVGRVIARWGERNALLEDSEGGVVRLACDGAAPAVGGFAEAVGFPASDLFRLTLRHAAWRAATPVPTPRHEVADISAELMRSARYSHPSLNANLHGRPVRMRAVLRCPPDGELLKDALLVESGDSIIRVDLGCGEAAAARLRPGSTVEVEGVCLLETEVWQSGVPFPQIKGFSIVVNAPEGLRLVAAAPWWTARRVWAAAALALAALLATLAWNRSLSAAVRRRGFALAREQLEHEKSRLKTEERTRLAVELHDSLAQSLTGISLEIATAERVAAGDPHGMRRHLTTAARALDSCREELKHCLWDLRGHALEARSVEEAVAQTLAPHVAGVAAHIRFPVPRGRLSDNAAHAVLKIVRELVLNAIRHGGATEVWVAGRLDGSLLRFSVRDNGCGFDPDAAPGFMDGHYGLVGIRERVEEYEGEFTLASRPGAGTEASVALRLPQRSAPRKGDART